MVIVQDKSGVGGGGRCSCGCLQTQTRRLHLCRFCSCLVAGGAGGAPGFVSECSGLGGMSCNYLSLGASICYFLLPVL